MFDPDELRRGRCGFLRHPTDDPRQNVSIQIVGLVDGDLVLICKELRRSRLWIINKNLFIRTSEGNQSSSENARWVEDWIDARDPEWTKLLEGAIRIIREKPESTPRISYELGTIPTNYPRSFMMWGDGNTNVLLEG